MKRQKTSHLRVCPAYPNAAGRGYYFRKLIDVITAIVSGIGFVAVMLFFLLL